MSVQNVVITPVLRLSYPKLVTPEPFTDAKGVQKGDPVYSTEFIVANEDMDKFKVFDEDTGDFKSVKFAEICFNVAKEKFPDVNIKEAVNGGLLSWPIKSGDAKYEEKGDKAAHYKNSKIVRGKALTKIKDRPNAPRLYYTDNGERKMIARGTDAGDHRAADLFYGGAYVFAELSIVAGDTSGKYVTCYINSVRFVKDGPRLGGTSLMDRFEGVTGGAADVNPSGNGDDDEIPF